MLYEALQVGGLAGGPGCNGDRLGQGRAPQVESRGAVWRQAAQYLLRQHGLASHIPQEKGQSHVM